MQKRVWYATTNHGKFEEVKRYIEEHAPSIELAQLAEELPEVQSMDQRAIALDKAAQAWNLVKEPVLVDDAGIYFEAYNEFPGTLTKFVYYGIGYEGLLKLVEQNNRAFFRLFMVYMDKDNKEVFEGRCDGKIIRPEKFDAHPKLPYDAIFLPDGTDKTYAELRGTPEEHEFAYRLRALKKFLISKHAH
jgi:XTP/dITP diphosphohydrolase